MKSSSNERKKVICCRLSASAKESNICPFPRSKIDWTFGNLARWIGCEISFSNDVTLYEVVLVLRTRQYMDRLVTLCESLDCSLGFRVWDCPIKGIRTQDFVWDQLQDITDMTMDCLNVSWFGTLSRSDFNFISMDNVFEPDVAESPDNNQLDTTEQYSLEHGISRRTFDLLMICQRTRLQIEQEEAKLADLEAMKSFIVDDEESTMFSSCLEPTLALDCLDFNCYLSFGCDVK
jgi:hypothetical protein